ncbi:MAG: hypothetical protein IKL70_05655 [Oscillospiraceae bacterium]|nr:hypothetical protein [Oscillospiraceae bacterium]
MKKFLTITILATVLMTLTACTKAPAENTTPDNTQAQTEIAENGKELAIWAEGKIIEGEFPTDANGTGVYQEEWFKDE